MRLQREYHSAIQRDGLSTHTATWMDPKEIRLSEKSQFPKVTYHTIPCMRHSQNVDVIEIENRSEVAGD